MTRALPPGYRELEIGEVIGAGDLYLSSSYEWARTPIAGAKHVNPSVRFATPVGATPTPPPPPDPTPGATR